MGISEEIEEMMITAEKTRVLGLKQRFKILNNKDETMSHVVKQKNKMHRVDERPPWKVMLTWRT